MILLLQQEASSAHADAQVDLAAAMAAMPNHLGRDFLTNLVERVTTAGLEAVLAVYILGLLETEVRMAQKQAIRCIIII